MDYSKFNESRPDESDNGSNNLKFFFNKDEYIQNAPRIVQDYYNGKGPNFKKGLFKTLIATPTNRFMLLSIFIFSAFVWFYSAFSGKDKSSISGINIELSAFSYEDSIYASIKFEQKPKYKKDPVNVKVVFKAVDNNFQEPETDTAFDVYDGQELFIRTKFFDYDIIQIKAEVSFGTDTKEFLVDVKHH